MATNRTTVIPIGIMPKTKRNFVMVFMETIIISVMVSIVFLFFFQQGNDTHTVLHIIDNIELKLDFANVKIANQIAIAISVKIIASRYFPQIAQPYFRVESKTAL